MKTTMSKRVRLSAEIFFERYGLDGRAPRSLEEVARAHGIRRATVRRLETEVLKRFRDRLAS
jgi:DNA-directed RNA polymerase sigma subunit (sigma70/sigma32)